MSVETGLEEEIGRAEQWSRFPELLVDRHHLMAVVGCLLPVARGVQGQKLETYRT